MQCLAEKLVGDADSAADAVQEAVIDIWEKRTDLDASTHMKAFCGTIVKRRCIDQLRKQRPSVPIDTENLLLIEPSPDDFSEDRYHKARQLVEQLPLRQRDAVLLKYEQGLTNKEIEKALGMSSTHLYATFSRAYKSIRTALHHHRSKQVMEEKTTSMKKYGFCFIIWKYMGKMPKDRLD